MITSTNTTQQFAQVVEQLNINGFHLSGGTDKVLEHSYATFYDKLVQQWRDRDCRILEIGSYQGGSLLVLHKLLPKAHLYSIDIQDLFVDHIISQLDASKVTRIIADAYVNSTIEQFKDLSFDIIIDDGSHQLLHQVFAITHYLPKITIGGSLIIEDLQDRSYYETLMQLVNAKRYSCSLHDFREIKKRYDDMIMVITRYA